MKHPEVSPSATTKLASISVLISDPSNATALTVVTFRLYNWPRFIWRFRPDQHEGQTRPTAYEPPLR